MTSSIVEYSTQRDRGRKTMGKTLRQSVSVLLSGTKQSDRQVDRKTEW